MEENTKEQDIVEVPDNITELVAKELNVDMLQQEEDQFSKIDSSKDLTAQFAEEMGIANEDTSLEENKTESEDTNTEEVLDLKQVINSSFRSKLGEDFSLSESATEETWVEELYEKVKEKEFSRLHPLVKDLQQAHERGLDPEDIIMDYASSRAGFSSMSHEEIVKNDLVKTFGSNEKRPKGWDEAKINSVVEKMKSSGMLEIEAEKIIFREQQNINSEISKKAAQRQAENLRYRQEIESKQNERIGEAIKKFEGWGDIYGIEIGQAEKSQFSKEFPSLVKPDPKTGKVWIEEQLSNDETLAKITYILKNEQAFKSAMTRAKERTKNKIFDKLDPAPRITNKSGTGGGIMDIDLDALAAPESIRVAK